MKIRLHSKRGRRIFPTRRTSYAATPIHSLTSQPRKKHPMKFLGSARGQMIVAALFLLPALAMAQDADKQKMIEIDKSFAVHPNAGPEAAAVARPHIFRGTLVPL